MIPTNDLVYAYRITRLPLLDAGGVAIGKIDDVVIVAGRGSEAPRVLGFVSSSQRRRIFISAARVAAVDNSGVRLKSFDIDLKPFLVREGERLIASDLLDKKVGDETVVDVALQHQGGHHPGWNVTHVRLAKRGALLTRPSFRLVPWTECATLFAPSTPVAAEAARLRGMHPSDVAAVIVALPIEQRRTIAAAMEDERLADVLEELPEDVFVTHGPHEPPTGGYLGVVHFQRLLREPPQTKLKDCVQHEPTIPPTMSEREVIIRIATYNLLSVAVVDAANHLLGAITVDDVLDRALPANWRMNERSHHPSAGTNANGGQP
ncbi:MAG: hypothetical protein EBY92_02850 [Actinobacteria bacterium]|nr:hypothetical protein [Actinomycetota bacterium]